MKFKEEDYGKPITKELSEFLKKFTTKDDRADASTKTGVSTSTIRDVARRTNMLTAGNSLAILAMIELAEKNCKYKIDDAQKSLKFLKL